MQFEKGMVMLGMARPRVMDKARLWRVVRYLAGAPRVEWRFHYQKPGVKCYVLCDADHASDEETRRSTSSAQAFVGQHLIDTESIKQQVIALSSGEAEFFAIGLGAAAGLFLWQVIEGIGFAEAFKVKKPTVYSDSSAARGACQRAGAGRLKHIHTRFLWTQEAVASNRMALECIDTDLNTADIGTKYVDAAKRSTLISMLPLTQKGLGSAVMVAAMIGIATLPVAGGSIAEIAVQCEPISLEEANVGGSSYWVLSVLLIFIMGYCFGKQARVKKQGTNEERRDRAELRLLSYGKLHEIMGSLGYTVSSTRLTQVLMAEVIVATKVHVGSRSAHSKGSSTSGGKTIIEVLARRGVDMQAHFTGLG